MYRERLLPPNGLGPLSRGRLVGSYFGCGSMTPPSQTIRQPDETELTFAIEPHRKHCLVYGLDDIGMTLQAQEAIRAFEARHRAAQPWLFQAD